MLINTENKIGRLKNHSGPLKLKMVHDKNDNATGCIHNLHEFIILQTADKINDEIKLKIFLNVLFSIDIRIYILKFFIAFCILTICAMLLQTTL